MWNVYVEDKRHHVRLVRIVTAMKGESMSNLKTFRKCSLVTSSAWKCVSVRVNENEWAKTMQSNECKKKKEFSDLSVASILIIICPNRKNIWFRFGFETMKGIWFSRWIGMACLPPNAICFAVIRTIDTCGDALNLINDDDGTICSNTICARVWESEIHYCCDSTPNFQI